MTNDPSGARSMTGPGCGHDTGGPVTQLPLAASQLRVPLQALSVRQRDASAVQPGGGGGGAFTQTPSDEHAASAMPDVKQSVALLQATCALQLPLKHASSALHDWLFVHAGRHAHTNPTLPSSYPQTLFTVGQEASCTLKQNPCRLASQREACACASGAAHVNRIATVANAPADRRAKGAPGVRIMSSSLWRMVSGILCRFECVVNGKWNRLSILTALVARRHTRSIRVPPARPEEKPS